MTALNRFRNRLQDALCEPREAAHEQARRLRAQRGFTLLEMLIVLALLALIMGLVVGPQVYDMFAEGQEKVAQTEVKSLQNQSYIRWQMKNPGKQCPDSMDELAKLAGKKEAKDPWGRAYIMRCGDQAPEGSNGLGILSVGPDGKEGTDDDIKSWEE